MGKKDEKFNDYQSFVNKFKPKLTTDDCYTPQEVYETILGWLKLKANIEGLEIIRPFWPGSDYEKQEYSSNCVVVDNPPFSILSGIVKFFLERNIKFFLFCPHLTSMHYVRFSTLLLTNVVIEYENGANINTDFITNLPAFYNSAIQTCPTLRKSIKLSQKMRKEKHIVNHPSYKYPDNVITVSDFSVIVRNDIEISIPRKETIFIRALESMKKKGKVIYGGGLLISNNQAEKLRVNKIESERLEKERLEKEKKKIEWTLSDQELELIESLSQNLNPQ